MIRPALSAVFDPGSLVVISESPLPGRAALPSPLAAVTTRVELGPDEPIILPVLKGVAPGSRPDLALVWVSPSRLDAALAALTPARPRAIVIYTMPDSAAAADRCHAWAVEHDCALIGPHSFGFQRPRIGLNASLHPTLVRQGRIALVTQSRTIMAAVMDWADDTRTAFSTVISLGDTGTVTLPAVVDFLATDPHTDSIALYFDHVENARELMSALRSAASAKPVIVLKTGLADLAPPEAELPPDTVIDAALRRAGALRVTYFVQLFSAIKALSQIHRPRGQRLALLANGTGPARLAQDAMARLRVVTKASLSSETKTQLAEIFSNAARVDNPVVEPARLSAANLVESIRHLLADSGVDALLIVLAPDPESELAEITTELQKLVPQARKPVITCMMGDAVMRRLRTRLAEAGVPSFRTPEIATDAFGQLARFHYNQQLLLQTQPPEELAAAADIATAHALLAQARAQRRDRLDRDERHTLFEVFRMPGVHAAHAVSELPAARIRILRDAVFGPVISLDSANAWPTASSAGVELLPLNGFLARRLIERSPLWTRVLARYGTPVMLDKLEDMLVAAADIAVALPDIQEIRLAPILLLDNDVQLMDAVVGLTPYPVRSPGHQHLAIAPYPQHWVRSMAFDDGLAWTLRPIRPEDAEPLQEFIRDLSAHTRYMRFISALRELPPRMLSRYTQVDYHRELALVATMQQSNPQHRNHPREVIIGLAHYLRNTDGVGAEYALVIADQWQRRRLGPILMQALISAARDQGLQYLEGVVLGTNRPMLKLMISLGFHNEPYPDDPTMRRVWLDLSRGS